MFFIPMFFFPGSKGDSRAPSRKGRGLPEARLPPEKIVDADGRFLVKYFAVMGQQLRKRLKRERRERYNKRIKARARQAKKA